MTAPPNDRETERTVMRCPLCKQEYEVTDFEAVLHHTHAREPLNNSEHSAT